MIDLNLVELSRERGAIISEIPFYLSNDAINYRSGWDGKSKVSRLQVVRERPPINIVDWYCQSKIWGINIGGSPSLAP